MVIQGSGKLWEEMLDERAGILGTKRLEGVTNRGLAVDAASVQERELEAA